MPSRTAHYDIDAADCFPACFNVQEDLNLCTSPFSVFTSPEQPSTPVHGVQSALNTGGSLPDLSSLHFPSPLPTPLDQDEPGYPGSSSLSGGSSTGNLASTLTQLGINAANAQGGNGNFHHHTQSAYRLLQRVGVV